MSPDYAGYLLSHEAWALHLRIAECRSDISSDGTNRRRAVSAIGANANFWKHEKNEHFVFFLIVIFLIFYI